MARTPRNLSGRPARDQFASAFVDLMTSLMVIFILLLVARLNNQAGMRAALAEKLERELRQSVPAQERSQIGRDNRDPNTIVITVPDQAMSFDLQEAALKPSGVQFLGSHIPGWAKILCSADVRAGLDTVVVEGHSDSTRWQGSSFEESKEKNLALSQQRSMAVVSTSLGLLRDNAAYRDCFLQTLSATGRGEEDPVDRETANSPKNRRVTFKIRLRPELAPGVAESLSLAQ